MENYANYKSLIVAQQVRQECAEKATVKILKTKERVDLDVDALHLPPHHKVTLTPYVDKESILSIDIEQFIK